MTPGLTFTASPISTVTPIPTPFLQIGKRRVITLNAMTDVSSPEGTTGVWFVGNDGFIAHKSDYGYISYSVASEHRHLNDVEFISADDGWIVGEGGLIMHWNGNDWQATNPAAGSRWPYSYDLYSVAFNKSDDGWAAGCTGSEGGEYFLVYHWDGTAWSEVSLSDERNLWSCVHDIAAFSPTDVWVVGTGWREGKEQGLTVHWDGERWDVVSELSSYNIYSLSTLSSVNIWAITGDGVVLNWNGSEWKEKIRLDQANLLFAQDPDDLFAVGKKIWYWNGEDWTDISLSSNFPADAEIKSLLAPYAAESGYFDLWMLDASGIIYTFTHPRTIRR
jgi:photosystem II stability/assembly factor-like uncharacterized protein